MLTAVGLKAGTIERADILNSALRLLQFDKSSNMIYVISTVLVIGPVGECNR